MDCLTKQLGISIPRSELAQTRYPSGITFPFTNAPSSSSASPRKPPHGAHLASSSTRKSGKPKPFKRRPSPKPPKSSLKYRPKRVSQVDEHDSEHVEHEEHDDQDDAKSSEGDPQVDFATLAINYSTIDTRHTVSDSYDDESSDDLPKNRRATRRH